jgi:ABC-type transporter Mla subunit MlaD
MTAQIAANRITRELNASEEDIDRALTSCGTLLATITQARIDTNAPNETVQVAIMRLAKGIGALSTARSDMIRTHAELRKVGETRGDLPGLPSSCDPTKAQAAAHQALKMVS